MVIIGKYDFEQFWELFRKFVKFHKSEGVYSPEVLSLLEMDEEFVKGRLKKLLEKARRSEEVLAIFEWKDGRMIAFAVATLEEYWAGGKLVSIDTVYVDEGYRGRGIGTRMIETIVRWAREKDARVMSVHVAVGNDGMIRLMKKFGFVPFNKNLGSR